MPISTRHYQNKAAVFVTCLAVLSPNFGWAQALSKPATTAQSLPAELTPEGVLTDMVNQSIAELGGSTASRQLGLTGG